MVFELVEEWDVWLRVSTIIFTSCLWAAAR